ncbi:TIGR04211 family SH3 domain-containing protein [Sansalvadorimonas verongulae]|uniref:TIGR04211 family SH3 domain-containing protein n=1 Tax=Sansalvadorimonas verongulae TaxID=2172824 RepID=UPI0012BCAE0D|nr:TIGR04211 family SH3 domain-containing protein [Sansalvadorimonas verongulae]MTI12995.1 TIGR04211 family SH3 domain-containing protein [Sansalvadorimonas verongulae]
MKRLIPLFMTLLTLSGMATAETVYIADTLYVPLRAGPGNEFRIVHRALKTGTALTLQEKEPDNGYYKVTTRGGLEGFVPSQYILFQPPAVLQLQAAQNEAASLKKQVVSLTQKLKETENTLKTTSSSLSNNTRSTEKLQEELTRIKAISSKSLELDKRNRELVVTNEQLMSELQTLQSTNQQLEDSSTQQWYLYGAGTLLIGLLFGLVAPMLQPRRKKSNWA